MKKSLCFVLTLLVFSFLIKNQALAQTATTTITYTGFQACGGCTVCGADYWCFNTPGSYCGNTGPCLTNTFADPCPAGSIVTSVQVNYFSADCTGGAMTATIDGNSVPTVNEGNTGCLCSNSPCGQSATSSSNYPCGLPGYVNGGNNSFQMCTGADVCINRIVLVFTYAPVNQATPAVAPIISGPSPVCAGTAYNYSASSSNASSYTWSFPPGWTINSGQGTGNVNATPGSAGNITVTAHNLCGSNSATYPVTLSSPSTAPTSASANPNPICPGNPTTLTVSGGSLGVGAVYTWYAGSCNSGVIGTGASISVSPASATTYFVNIVGTCNTTACTSVLVNVNGVQPTPGAPSGTTSVCNGSTQVYTTTGSVGATSYNWTVPAGTSINSGQGTTSINATIGSTSGNICVTATGACGTSAAACTPITITSVPSSPTSITGVTPVCLGSDNYSIGSVAGATSYSWSVSGGGSITGGQGTTAATINWTTPGSWIVNCAAVNSCGNSTAATFPITINPNPNITITPSSTAVCSGSVATMTASGAGGGSYSWSPDASITSALNNAAISAIPTISPTNYNVTGTDGNGCTGTANVSITVNPSPTVTVVGGGSNSQTVCSGGSVSGINFSVSPAGTVNWTNSNPAIGVAASGSGNIAGYTAPTVTIQTTGIITVNATASGSGCASTSSTNLSYTITLNPLPGLTAPTITPASCGASDGTITGATGTGGSGGPYSYSWDGGATYGPSSSYTNAAGTYPLTVQDNVTGCTFTQNISIPNAGAPPPPVVTVSPSATVCVGGTVVLSAPTIPGMTYSWTESGGATGTGDTYTVTNIPGSPNPYLVTVTSTSMGCTGAAGTTSLTVNQPPNAAISTTTSGSICAGTCTTLSVTPIGANYTYQWGNSSGSLAGDVADTLKVCTAGSYTVLVTNTVTTCSAVASANGTINVNTLPVIDTSGISNTQSSCTAPTGSVTNVTITGNPGFTYTWTSGGSTAGPVVSTGSTVPASLLNVPAGAYCINVTDANGCTSNFCSVNVTDAGAPATPTLTATAADTMYCQGTTLNTLTVTVTNTGTTTPTVNWYGDAALTNTLAINTNTYTPTGLSLGTNTIYVVAVANGCTSISRPVIITINPLPAAPVLTSTLSNPVVECQGVSPAPTLSVAVGGTVTAIPVWYVGTSTVNIGTTYAPSTTFTGTTIYTILDSSTTTGCTSLSTGSILNLTVTINSTPAPPTASSSNASQECQGQNPAVTLSVTPAPGSTPVWYNASGNVVAINTNTYTPPNGSAGNNTYIVIDSSNVPPNTCTSLAAGNVLTIGFTINPAPTPPVITNTATTITDCIGVPMTPVVVNTGTTIPAPIPVWYNSSGQHVFSGNPFIPPSTVGTDTYTVVDSSSTGTGCFSLSSSSTQSVIVTVYPSPTIDVTGQTGLDSANCGKAGSFTINPAAITSTGTPPLHYQWYNGSAPILNDTTLTLTNASGGPGNTYSLQITDVNGCQAVAASGTPTSFTIPSVGTPSVNMTTSPSPATGNVPLDIAFTTSVTSVSGVTYNWMFGDGNGSTTANPSNTYTTVGTFTVVLVVSNGSCTDTVRATVIADVPTTIIIPNVFSPNGDNINDQFFIINTGMTSLNCQIFNRWGQLLATLTAPNQSWDGRTPNGDNAPDGTYMFILQAQGLDGKTYKQQGTVTLVR